MQLCMEYAYYWIIYAIVTILHNRDLRGISWMALMYKAHILWSDGVSL